MKNLEEILNEERTNSTISNLAKSLGFKSDTIKLYFMSTKEIDALNIVVNVDYAVGNANNAYLLEAKLNEKFGIDVVVISAGKVTDPLNKLEVDSSSFAMIGSESEMSQFLNKSLDKILFRKSEIDDNRLKRHLKLADRTITEVAKRKAALATQSKLFTSEPQIELAEAEIEEFLSPENKGAATETLKELPKNLLSNVISLFNSKKRKDDNQAPETKRYKTEKPSALNNNNPTIHVK